eukprot:320085_1
MGNKLQKQQKNINTITSQATLIKPKSLDFNACIRKKDPKFDTTEHDRKIIESRSKQLVIAYIEQINQKNTLIVPLDVINMILLYYEENTFKWTIKLDQKTHNSSYSISLFDTDIKTTFEIKFVFTQPFATLQIVSKTLQVPHKMIQYCRNAKLYAHIICNELSYDKQHIRDTSSDPINYDQYNRILCGFTVQKPIRSLTFDFYFAILPSTEMRYISMKLNKYPPKQTFVWNLLYTMDQTLSGSIMKSPIFYNDVAFYLTIYQTGTDHESGPAVIKLCVVSNPMGYDEKLFGGNIKILDHDGTYIEQYESNITNDTHLIPISSIKTIEFTFEW